MTPANSPMRWAALIAIAAGAPLLGAGCRDRSYRSMSADAGTDGDAGGGATDAAQALTIDISVTGCGSYSADAGCSGPAPLTVRFAPVGSPVLNTFLWSFGDGTAPVSDRAPSHTYALPGRYDVSVKGGAQAVGTVPATRPGLIQVKAIGAGGACDVDAQCDTGLGCACARGNGCGPAFARGICSTPCPTGFCGDRAVCAAYDVPAPAAAAPPDAAVPDGGINWSPICLAGCADSPCPAGFTCHSFHAGGSGASGWVRGCLPTGAVGELGSGCRNAAGELDNGLCASGTCGPFGTNGLCAASCQAPLGCPAGAACARVGTSQVCLAACSADTPCAADPQLACRAPSAVDAGSDAGLAVVSGDFNQTYCAPR